MELDCHDVLRLLAEADNDRRRPELCDARFAVVSYVPGSDYDPEDDGLDEDSQGELVGEAASVYDALDLLAAEVGLDDPGELVEHLLDEDVEEGDYEQWLGEADFDAHVDHYASLLRQIRSPHRRTLAYLCLGLAGPYDFDLTEPHQDAYLGGALLHFGGARFVFLVSAVPPAQDEAYAILECQPIGAPPASERALLTACAEGDTEGIASALANGAEVNALDERGMSPLHHATAHRKPAAVRALLNAGTDPGGQGEFGNAPHFCGLDDGGRPGSALERVETEDQDRILRALVDAGAPLNVTDRAGDTLLDLAISTRPYPTALINHLRDAGARSARLTEARLPSLLRRLPYFDRPALETTVNQVRFLVAADAHRARHEREEHALRGPHTLLGMTGYYEHEVPGEILLELVEELLRGDVRDAPLDEASGTALDKAVKWAESGSHDNYWPAVERLRTAARTTEGA